MISGKLVFRLHAIQRMFQRQITVDQVRHVLTNGEVIESYPDDTPYPSRLILGWSDGRPLHVLVADDLSNRATIVITVYEPASAEWGNDFKRRKR